MKNLVDYIHANDPTPKEIAIAHLIAGLSLFDQGDYEAALQEWDIAVMRDPENVNAFVYQGWAMDQQGRFAEAIQKYRQVLNLDPKIQETNRTGARLPAWLQQSRCFTLRARQILRRNRTC